MTLNYPQSPNHPPTLPGLTVYCGTATVGSPPMGTLPPTRGYPARRRYSGRPVSGTPSKTHGLKIRRSPPPPRELGRAWSGASKSASAMSCRTPPKLRPPIPAMSKYSAPGLQSLCPHSRSPMLSMGGNLGMKPSSRNVSALHPRTNPICHHGPPPSTMAADTRTTILSSPPPGFHGPLHPEHHHT